MATARARLRDGAEVAFQLDGRTDFPVVVLSNPIASNRNVWERVAAELTAHFRVLRYDTRGQGESTSPAGPYSLAMLGQDLLDVLDALGLERIHFCGLSLGGMTGMWLAANHGHRIRSLSVCNSTPSVPPPTTWDERIALVEQNGMRALRPVVLSRWLSSTWVEANASAAEQLLDMILSAPIEGYVGACAAIRDADLRIDLGAIECPVLAVGGAWDAATPAQEVRSIVDHVKGRSRYVELKCGHLSNVEQPVELAQELSSFIEFA